MSLKLLLDALLFLVIASINDFPVPKQLIGFQANMRSSFAMMSPSVIVTIHWYYYDFILLLPFTDISSLTSTSS